MGTFGRDKSIFCICVENIENWVHTHVLIMCKPYALKFLYIFYSEKKKKNEKTKKTKKKKKKRIKN